MTVRFPFHALTALAALALMSVVPPAWATNSCKLEAKQNFKDCKADCKEDFQAAKDACLNRDHFCVEVCRAERYECRVATGFDAAIDACNDDLEDAKQECRDNPNNPPGSGNRDACIDAAQIVAFQCRDAAREEGKPKLKLCRKAFALCAQACPPPDPPSSVNPSQCKVDAKNVYVACKNTCIEEFQINKDACRNRDHTCVEGCRENREACRAPVEDELASDIAACNLTLHGDGTLENPGAIETCKSLYAEGTPERDQCIDNAQVDAFQCRDQAREDARPGFQACRDDFRTCAQGCPLAIP
jgi:hypothetical protein